MVRGMLVLVVVPSSIIKTELLLSTVLVDSVPTTKFWNEYFVVVTAAAAAVVEEVVVEVGVVGVLFLMAMSSFSLWWCRIS